MTLFRRSYRSITRSAEGRELAPLARRFAAILRGIVEEIGE